MNLNPEGKIVKLIRHIGLEQKVSYRQSMFNVINWQGLFLVYLVRINYE